MTDELDRISLTIPPKMVKQLDAIVDEWEYPSRSAAIRDSLRDFFVSYEWESTGEAVHRGTIVIVHDHHVAGLADELQLIQHEMADVITSVQHVHLSGEACMETLIVDGPASELTELANRLRSLGGVRQVKIVVVE